MLKKYIFMILCIFVLLCSGCAQEKQKLELKLSKSTSNKEIKLNDFTDFKWDTVYFISPYISKGEIEKEISIESNEIEDNYYDESEVYILFAYKNDIVYKISGRPESLGFDFDVGKYDRVKKINVNQADFFTLKDGNIVIYNLK